MASTRGSDLADVGRDGNTDLTPITDAMAAERGFPMELRAGGVVNIVRRKQIGGGQFAFTASDGTEYVLDGGHTGKLVEAPAEDSAKEAIPADAGTGAEAESSEAQDAAEATDETGEAPEGAQEDVAGEETSTE